MVLYHIDRCGLIEAPGRLSLSPSGRSSHGDYYWKDKPMSDFDSVMNSVTEHLFEAVRFASFPDRPSRFSSFFACTPEQIGPWLLHFDLQGVPVQRVWEVEATETLCLDASLLLSFWAYPEGLWFDPAYSSKCAHAYWAGESLRTLTDDRTCPSLPWLDNAPHWETLAGFPVQVIRRLPLEEIESLRRGQPRTAL